MENTILKKLTTIENLLKDKTEKPLTIDEAAVYLDVAKSTLYKLTSAKKIPHYSIVIKYRVRIRCYLI